ncbi:hypothetical protein BH11ARM2_BH11ARM2_39290 [soil metagenome]
MNCNRVQGLLNAYLDREMTGRETLAVRQHLKGCDQCRALADELSLVKSFLGRLPDPEPSPDFEARLLHAIHAEIAPLLPVAPRWRPALVVVGMAGVSMVLTFAALSATRGGGTPVRESHDTAIAFEIDKDRSFGFGGSSLGTPVFAVEHAPR